MRTALISGVSRGIGLATARLFLKEGWRVIGTDLKMDISPCENLTCHEFDASDPDESSHFFDELKAKGVAVSALVNNAAVQICRPLVQTTPEEWEKVIRNNLSSVYLMVRNSYPLMKESGGAIVNVSSVHANATSANIAGYAASKGAMVSLTRALAIELAPDRIRVNAVLPGAVDTSMLRDGLDRGHLADAGIQDRLNQLGQRHLLGRIGKPDEIAEGILFLSDEERSSFITGQTLVIDGGALAKLSTE